MQRTTEALQKNRFIETETIEVLLRPYEFKHITLKSPDIAKVSSTFDFFLLIIFCFVLLFQLLFLFVFAFDFKTTIEESGKEEEGEEEEVESNEQLNNNIVEEIEVEKLNGTQSDDSSSKRTNVHRQYLSAIPLNDIAGHTGFLTFATKF